ncbi:hypothetical protein NECAME_06477 [Necator americanus]|uniref:DOC domain-containing protein n=1 Tax=Necator americanus TaxID=51031 RepID=W2TW27_NECAM|nr:hypothetical protein NECAME_06477 [Necator americanus]ETN85251.1 hypothetical protein NECAME_06477 [Necator americanus]
MNRCRYMSISAMPAYLNYCYEEIRLGFTKATVVREKINLKHKNNCTFEGEWTPTVAGSYRVACRVDGCELTHNYLIEVWCLAYHQHLRRELIPVVTDMMDRPSVRRQEDPPTLHTSPAQQSVIIEANETYILDASQRIQLYSRPSPDAVIEGAMLEGRTELEGSGWVSNQHGVWVRVANNNQFILAENSIGRSSIQSQSLSINGNEEEERSPPARQQGTTSMAIALRPSVAECCRTVFAAFLWHEHLVKDAMAAAAYLKFHQHLHNLWSNSDVREAAAPAALQPIVRLWIEICTTVRTSVDQHLIVPPTGGKTLGTMVETKRREAAEEGSFYEKLSPAKIAKAVASGGGCELCNCSFKVPVTVHMRMNHPGCGQDAQGYGYNSSGKFTSGWSGDCGSGGRAASTWYLLCSACRAQYLRKTPAGFRQERARRWREFRLSANAFDSRPEIIMRQNAVFLLDLNSSLDCDSKASSTATSGWTINLFPTQTPSPSAMGRSGPIGKKVVDSALFARSSFLSQSLSRTGHASDPGPKALPTSPPVIAMQSLAMDGTRSDEGDAREVLQSPSAALRTLISHQTPTTGEMLKRPVLAFVVEHHDLKRLRAACEQSIIRAVGFSHAFRSSGVDARLRSLCFKAWTIQLTAHEQELLILTCNILGTVGGVLSEPSISENWITDSTDRSNLPQKGNNNVDVKLLTLFPVKFSLKHQEMRDLTNYARIEASSRQAMVVCLTDGSPETFWESGEEVL